MPGLELNLGTQHPTGVSPGLELADRVSSHHGFLQPHPQSSPSGLSPGAPEMFFLCMFPYFVQCPLGYLLLDMATPEHLWSTVAFQPSALVSGNLFADPHPFHHDMRDVSIWKFVVCLFSLERSRTSAPSLALSRWWVGVAGSVLYTVRTRRLLLIALGQHCGLWPTRAQLKLPHCSQLLNPQGSACWETPPPH